MYGDLIFWRSRKVVLLDPTTTLWALIWTTKVIQKKTLIALIYIQRQPLHTRRKRVYVSDVRVAQRQVNTQFLLVIQKEKKITHTPTHLCLRMSIGNA